jgi:hypothetical protein
MLPNDPTSHAEDDPTPDLEIEAFHAYENAIRQVAIEKLGHRVLDQTQAESSDSDALSPSAVNRQEVEEDGVRAEAIRREKVRRLSKP